MQIDKYFRHAHVDFELVMNFSFWDERFDLEMSSAKARLIFMSWLQGFLPIRIQAFSKMPASKLGLATRAFVAVLLVLARRYESILNVKRGSPADELAKSYKKGGALFWSRPPRHMDALSSRVSKSRKSRKNARTQHPKITLSRDKSFIKIIFSKKSPFPSLES